jgi:Mg2+ and Co2+ transporter CorA
MQPITLKYFYNYLVILKKLEHISSILSDSKQNMLQIVNNEMYFEL